MPTASTLPQGLDRAGVLVSGACAAHCALMPFVAAALPVAGLELFAGETAEWLLIAASVVLAVASMAGGCRHHRQWRPAAIVAIGFALIVIGRTVFEEGAWQERAAVIGGALGIASAHLLNWRLCCAART